MVSKGSKDTSHFLTDLCTGNLLFVFELCDEFAWCESRCELPIPAIKLQVKSQYSLKAFALIMSRNLYQDSMLLPNGNRK
jgi:hypothetical protein